jgi:hypothetical protein
MLGRELYFTGILCFLIRPELSDIVTLQSHSRQDMLSGVPTLSFKDGFWWSFGNRTDEQKDLLFKKSIKN